MNKAVNYPTISLDEVIRPTVVEVDLNILKNNFINIKSYIGRTKIMPILKANAYGHGLIRTAQLYQQLNADYLGVAVVEEGMLLRLNGINVPILVLGGIWGNQIPLFLKHKLTITASSIDKLNQIDDTAAKMKLKAKVHLKIDTGMERIGVHYYSSEKFIEAAHKFKNIFIEGIYSHFANADSDDVSETKLQLERFHSALNYLQKYSMNVPFKHISNSAAIVQMPEANFDLVRPGILLYGIYPSEKIKKNISVKPALVWKSRIVYFKVIRAGDPVGYGSTWKSDHQIRAVTVPVGYGDGYFRSLSNKSKVIIRGKKYPVIGTVSMDQIVINIESDCAFNGDEVILLGESEKEKISAADLAKLAGTIPYEILTNINTRVPRIYK